MPYVGCEPRNIRLAMKIGGEYRLSSIGLRQWQKAAKEIQLDTDFVIARVRELSDRISERVAEVTKELHQEGLRHPILARLEKTLTSERFTAEKFWRPKLTN
jgi:serine/threonine-protein kinase HipA